MRLRKPHKGVYHGRRRKPIVEPCKQKSAACGMAVPQAAEKRDIKAIIGRKVRFVKMKAMIEAKTLRRIVMATKRFVATSGGTRVTAEYIKLEFRKDGNTVTAAAVDGYRLSVEHAVCGEIDEDFDAYIKPVLPPIRKSEWAVVSVVDKKCYIEIGGMISGFNQPEGTFLDYQKAISTARTGEPSIRIGFNGEYLLSALQAAKASNGDAFRLPVILELRSPTSPAFIDTNNGQGLKMVLPIRLREE